MIELRWLERPKKSADTYAFSDVSNTHERVLQFRYMTFRTTTDDRGSYTSSRLPFGGAYIEEWSEWQDVPLETETTAPR